jgi:hypothetical protein
LQFAGQFAGLEGSHTAGHTEQDVAPAQFARISGRRKRVSGDQ